MVLELPKKPRPLSEKPQNRKILKWFFSHPNLGLSVGEASDLGFGCDLRKRISELKKCGYEFSDCLEQNMSVGYHKRYYLVQKVAA